MSYDLYVDRPQGDAVTQLRLLVTKRAQKALSKYIPLVHETSSQRDQRHEPPALYPFIADQLQRLRALNINPPPPPDLSALPPAHGSCNLPSPWRSPG